jgi:hypothetical protein
MELDVLICMRGNPFLGPFEGVGPESRQRSERYIGYELRRNRTAAAESNRNLNLMVKLYDRKSTGTTRTINRLSNYCCLTVK